MISFSTQRFSRFLQLTTIFLSGLLLSNLLQAQNSEDLFKGTWQIDTPEQGALIMIVKSQGRASYFWGDNTDRSVYQGTWSLTDSTATLTWADGSQHRIERDTLGFSITHIDTNGSERYTAQAEQVPQEILGQWAKPPSRDDTEVASDRDKAKGFFGIWKIGDDDTGNIHYIFVESDRSAANTEGDLRGSWAKQGSELHIAWDSGHYSILRENQRSFAYKKVAPGEIIEDDETEFTTAERTIEDNVPSAWLADYKSEREVYTGGIAFSSRKNARLFYRGDWIIQHSEKRFERVTIERFGGLKTSADRTLGGDWRMQGQDIFMRWDDGIRKILGPIGRGFVLYEFKPGRPLDGVPSRLRPAAPSDAAKLAEHLKGRADVAQQMVSLAEAAGIDTAQQEQAGWGRTFARWAWPFGEDETVSSEALLEEEFEVEGNTDPWWWPFWSERELPEPEAVEAEEPKEMETTVLETSEMEAPAEETTVAEIEEVPSVEEATAPQPEVESADTDNTKETTEEPKKRKPARDWSWPF